MYSDNTEQTEPLGKKLSELVNHSKDDPKELLKYRLLCLEGVLGIYGQTGIGKSSFAMQCMILWSLGRPAFGIHPRRPLKSLIIQAENDDGDIAEMRDGVCDGLGLSHDEKLQAGNNIIVVHEDSKYGSDFFTFVVEIALATHKPDMLWIDPVLSYLGGDSISQEVVGKFLRNMLKPMLRKHQCGCVIVHHTNKTGNTESPYAGSGSAEWANMPRAILVLSRSTKGTFDLTAAKKGQRIGWKMEDGITPTTSKRLIHSSIEGRIFWEEVDSIDDLEVSLTQNQQQDTQQNSENQIFQRVPELGTIPKKELVAKVNKETNLGQNKIKAIIKEMIQKQTIYAESHPRSYGPAEIHISRKLSKKEIILRKLELEDPEIRKSIG